MGMISDKGGVKAPAQSSRSQNTAVGSGSRPTPSQLKIPSSAPSNPRTRGIRAAHRAPRATPHARTIEFLTQVLALGLRVWLGPYDITEACRIALDRIAEDLAHA